jgi:UbiD family decarboxylase
MSTTSEPSLRAFLDAVPEAVFRVPGEVDLAHGITALQHALEGVGRYPVVVVERPRRADGSVSEIGVVCNLTASRALAARALGLADHRSAARELAARLATRLPPVEVAGGAAPVQANVRTGDDADLAVLPALTQHVMDAGPYLTAAHATTCDPDTDIDNTAIQRCWIKGARRTSYYTHPGSHNARNVRKFWARGDACPIAFWIGHHPAVSIGAQAKLGYPESHWPAAGALAGAPVRLVPTLTHGSRIRVPADAEIVIEGFVPPARLEADGPFGEYTGYMGPQTLAPVCEVTAITWRDGALYHDYGSGLRDMLVPDNLANEARLYQLVRAVAPSLANVHVPVSGRRFHAYLQLERPAPGEARAALAAALAYRRVKAAVAVDEDVDLFAEEAVLWAIATRVQWRRDAFVLDGLSGSSLDPSWPAGALTTSKLGIDATLAPSRAPDVPRPVPPRARVPDEALTRARRLLEGFETGGWPAI